MCPNLCVFLWGFSGLRYVTDAPVSMCIDFVILYMVWGYPTVFT